MIVPLKPTSAAMEGKLRMYKANEWNEILELRKGIREAIFKEKESPKDEQKESQSSPVRIRIYNAERKRFFSEVIRFRYCPDPSSDSNIEPANLIGDFLLELAQAIWHHKQHMKPEFSQYIWLEDDRDYLLDMSRCLRERGYSEKVITNVTELLEKDLSERYEELRGTRDYKYFSLTNPLSHPWIARENEVIAELRSIYKKYTPLTDRKIISSMALLFVAMDFWTDGKGEDMKARVGAYFERTKKRFQKIDKDQSETVGRSKNE